MNIQQPYNIRQNSVNYFKGEKREKFFTYHLCTFDSNKCDYNNKEIKPTGTQRKCETRLGKLIYIKEINKL